MPSVSTVQAEMESVLAKVAQLKHIENYEVKTDLGSITGEGFLGELFFGSLIDKSTGETTEIVVKKPVPPENLNPYLSDSGINNAAYATEVLFYDKIFPALEKFQKAKTLEKPFSSIPTYFFGTSDIGKQVIVMENLKSLGYKSIEKEQVLEAKHIERALKAYGEFHALSFCLKDQHPEHYENILEGERENVYHFIAYKTPYTKVIPIAAKKCLEFVDQEKERDLWERLMDYVENGMEIFKNSMDYKGKHGGILHGDSWSNNMMFRYDDIGNVEDIRIVDFQAFRTGSVVTDISYFLYSSGGKEIFDQLDYFLKIYHDSFSTFAKQLGSDPEKLLPWHILKKEWKIYAKYAICVSFNNIRVKLRPKEFINDPNAQIDEKLYRQRIRDILDNAYETGAL